MQFFSNELGIGRATVLGTNAELVNPLQAVELQPLTGKPLPYKQLIALTDYIRKSELFPEWHTSQTAELYKPHSFNNQKDAAGYWW